MRRLLSKLLVLTEFALVALGTTACCVGVGVNGFHPTVCVP